MAKDMGINRYICRVCGFGHDRSQSVQVHGKKEHGTEEVVQDRIGVSLKKSVLFICQVKFYRTSERALHPN